MEKEPHQLAEQGKRAFAAGRYAEAAEAFRQASLGATKNLAFLLRFIK